MRKIFSHFVVYIIMLAGLLAFMYFYVSDEKPARELNTLGNQYLNEGKYEQAKLYYIRASGLRNISDSMRSIYFSNLALAYLKFPIPDSARYYFKKSAELYPENSYKYLVGMANVSLLYNDVSKALSLFKKAYLIDSSGLEVNNFLGLIYLGNYDPSYEDPAIAIRYNQKAFDLLNSDGSKDGISKSVLAENYYKLNNLSKATALFEELHREYPMLSDYLKTLIMMKQENGQFKDVEALMSELSKKDSASYKELKENPLDSGSHAIIWSPESY